MWGAWGANGLRRAGSGTGAQTSNTPEPHRVTAVAILDVSDLPVSYGLKFQKVTIETTKITLLIHQFSHPRIYREISGYLKRKKSLV